MRAWLLPALMLPVLADDARASDDPRIVVIRAAVVHRGDGEVYRPGAVVIEDGKVLAVGASPALPSGARVVDCGDLVVTPGLVDAACQLGTDEEEGFSEQSSEIIPQLDLADSVDYFSRDFERLSREGVTTVYLTPEAASVISSRGMAVKTAGPIDQRPLDAPPVIKATLGPEASYRGASNRAPSRFREVTFLARRPTTRMGSTFVFRKAFYDARRFHQGKSVDEPAAMAELVRVLEGEVGLRFQARQAHDIFSAIRLCSEFGLSCTIEYGTEAFRCLDLLAEHETPVILGPLGERPRGVTRAYGDAGRPCLTTATQLAERGIPFCLTACDLTGEEGLVRQAGLARRHGLDADHALAAITSIPARMIGLAERVGSLESGRDGDLVVWSGSPLEATSRAVLVLVGGRAVYDPDGRFAPATP